MGYLGKIVPSLVVFLALLSALYAIYQPVTQGYYLYTDDYWTYIDRGKPLSSNDAFRSQAIFVGRPLGALFDLLVFRSLRSISDVNYARFFSIFLFSMAGFALYRIINKYGIFRGRAAAFLITIAVFSLPSFQSNIISLFEINSILAIILSILAASISIDYLGKEGDASPILHVISACLLLIIAAFTYTNAITFYWAMLGCYLLGISPSSLDKKFRDHVVAFILPMVSMGIYYVHYKTLVTSSHLSYSLIAPSMYTVIAKLPIFLDFLEISFNFWFTPNKNSGGELVSNISIISLSIATIFLGCIYGIRKDIEAIADFHLGKLGLVFRKYLMIAVIFILSVSPVLLSSLGDSVQMRRLQSLQTISLILVLWSVKQIISHFFVRSEKVAMTVFLIVICLVGSFKANHDVRKIFVEPLSAELSYIKSEIRKGLKRSANMHVHILVSGRMSTRIDSIGFMSSSHAFPPGMVVSVIGDLAAEDDSFIKYKDTWGLGYAEDHVTNSSNDELERGLISLNRLNVIIIDLSNIEHYIDPYIVASDSVESSFYRGTNIFANTPTNDVNVTWRAMEGLPLSNGDYPGFPKSGAFDGDFSFSRWGSAQTGVSIENNAWIGFDFGLGLEKHIRHIRVRQGGAIKSGIVQQSADGVEWVTVGNVSLVTDNNIRAYHLPQSKPTRYWRLLSDENMTPPAAWTVYEIQMAE